MQKRLIFATEKYFPQERKCFLTQKDLFLLKMLELPDKDEWITTKNNVRKYLVQMHIRTFRENFQLLQTA